MHNPAFEGVSVFRRSPDERFSSLEVARYACVEKIELSRLDRLARAAFPPDWDFLGKECVFEDSEVFLYGASRNLRIGRDGLVVDLLAARKRGNLEKAAECRKIACRAFLYDFLFKVKRDIAGDVFVGRVGIPNAGDKPIVDGTVEIECIAEFGCGEWMDVAYPCAPTEKVHSALAQFSGT